MTTGVGHNQNPFNGEHLSHGEANYTSVLDPLPGTEEFAALGEINTYLEQRSTEGTLRGVGESAIQPPEEIRRDAAESVHENKTDIYRKHYDYNERTGEGTLEVIVESDLTLEDYKAVTPPEEWERLEAYAK